MGQVVPIAELSPPDTLLGKLQRGRGAGFLEALERDPAEVHPLLVECITRDPRWDTQGETRDSYYAELVLATGMDIAPIEQHLREHEADAESGLVTGLASDVVEELIARSHDQAIRFGRDYVAWGKAWDWIIAGLMRSGDPASWHGLDKVLNRRFSDIDEFREAFPYYWPGSDEEPWRTWRSGDTFLARAIRQLEQERAAKAENRTRARYAFPGMSTNELLAYIDESGDWPGSPIRLAMMVLRDRTTEADTGPLLEAVAEARHPKSTMAALALRERADPRVFEPALRLISAGHASDRNQVVFAAAGALAALPAETVLPLARAWRTSPDYRYRHAADYILEEYATVEDIPWILQKLRLPHTPRRTEHFGHLLDMLSRFPGIGRIAEVERIYYEAPHSYLRWRAATTMALTDPEFSTHCAFECLWDCNAGVREIGCEQVNLSIPAARRRVEELAAPGHDLGLAAAIDRLAMS